MDHERTAGCRVKLRISSDMPCAAPGWRIGAQTPILMTIVDEKVVYNDGTLTIR